MSTVKSIVLSLFFIVLLTPALLARSFPNVTSDTVAPFADQLSTASLNDAQVSFFANNYYGTQKQYVNQIARYRAVNPNFLQLHYRLAQEAGPAPGIAHDATGDGSVNGNAFSSEEWTTFAQNQDWYILGTDGQRVRNSAWDWYPFDLIRSTTLRNQVADYWVSRVALEATATNSDGVFADSAGQLIPPYSNSANLPNYFPSSPNFNLAAGQNFIANGYSPYSARVWSGLQAQNITYLPNLGQMVTSWDSINNYLNSDGGMVEGFTGFGSSIDVVSDWKLEINNMLTLARNNKIIIAQTPFDTVNDYTRRSFIVGSYLLGRGSKSFIYMYSGSYDQWYPEYDLDMGSYTGAIPSTVDDLAWNGVYRRNYANGMVLVNPTSAPVTVTLGSNYNQTTFNGGGNLPTTGVKPGSTTYSSVNSTTVPARGSVFLLNIANQPVDADSDGYNSAVDCNDSNANINPGRTEVIGNGLDDDCNAATLDTLPGDANVFGQIATVGSDSTAHYSERSAGVTGATNYIINNVAGDGLGTQLTDNQGLYIYTSRTNIRAYYRVTDVNNNAVTNLQAFHRNGQTFITWTENGAASYKIYREQTTSANAVTVDETNNPIQPVLSWQQGGRRVYTLYLPQDAWSKEIFQGQGHNFYVGAPPGYNYNSPARISTTVHMEGYGTRYTNQVDGSAGSAYDANTIYVRVDEPPVPNYGQGWYFGHYCNPQTPSQGVCNYLENAILEMVLSLQRNPQYNIDPDRVYAYGHSMGGTGAIRLGIRYPEVFTAVYASEPVTDFGTTGSLGGTNWTADVSDSRGTPWQNYAFHPVGASKAYLSQFDGQPLWTYENLTNFICTNKQRSTAVIALAHGTADNTVDTDTQGYPFYLAAANCKTGIQAEINNYDHRWQGFSGIGQNLMNPGRPYVTDIFNSYQFTKASFPAFSYAQNSKNPATTGTGTFNQDLLWSMRQDTTTIWEALLTSTSSNQRVDVTPRRARLTVSANQQFTWQRKDAQGNVLESGQVQADATGLVYVPQLLVTTTGTILTLTAGAVGPDVTPPVISSLNSAPSQTTATVSFNTNEATTATIEYGLTTAYGTVQSQASATTHSFTLNTLTSNTTYYYRVNASDAAGNKATQSATFATQVLPIDADGDGFFLNIAPFDCNDNNALVNPNRQEILNNGIDDDCNASTSDTVFNEANAINLAASLPVGYEPSGVVWHPLYNALFLVSDGGTLSKMSINGTNVTNWNVAGDLEGVTTTNASSPYVYIAVEYPFAVIQFNPLTGQVVRTVSLTGVIPAVVSTNSGIEAITFVPNGFHPYAASNNGGLFYIGVQENGVVYAVDINFATGTATLVNSITPVAGRTDIAGLDFGLQTKALSVLYDSSNFLREIYVNNTLRAEYTAPGLDQEGISIITNCPNNRAIVVIAEDSGRVMKYSGYPINCAPIDADADGYNSQLDCDDNNALVNPGRTEVTGNGIDDDCNAATSDNPVVNQTNQTVTGTFNISILKDTYLYDGYSNQGVNPVLKMYKERFTSSSRILVQFNNTLITNQLNTLGANLVYARVKIYHTGQFFDNITRSASIYALTRTWTEGTGAHEHDYGTTGANWTHASTATPWTTPGGDYNAQLLSATDIPLSTATPGWVQFDITNNSLNSNGYIIDVNGDWREDQFASRENANTALRPVLEIGYALNTPVDSTAPNATNIIINPSETTATFTFNTNENATSNLQYNISKPNATTVLGLNHSISLTSLVAKTTYNYTLRVTDTSSNTRVYTGQFTTLDLTAPVVSSKVVTPRETNATISLATNEQATVTLSYGPTLAYGTNTVQSGTTFAFTLIPLNALTTYFYKINATDTSGNSVIQLGNLTTLDSTPPTVTTTSNPSGTTVAITVNTNEQSTVAVTIPAVTVTQTSSNGLLHTFTATGLNQQTFYVYNVTATDASGNKASKLANFTTLDTTAPVITLTNTPSGNYDVLNVTTNEAATINVVLPGAQVNLVSTNGLTKIYNLTNLQEKTNYSVQVTANDSSGNVATQNTQFTTLDVTPAQITNLQITPNGRYAQVAVTANEPATITLTRQDGGNVQVITTTPTSATFNLTALQEQTTYNFTVQLRDNSNNVANFQNTLTTLDKTSPTINALNNPSGIHNTITVTTNEQATVTVNVPNALTTLLTTNGLTHVFNITQLNEQTSYSAQITAVDSSGNTANAQSNFTTLDQTPPVVSNLQVNPQESTTSIALTTNENATVALRFGVTNEYGQNAQSTGQNHAFNLNNLQSVTTYYYEISSTDSSNNRATQTGTFTTLDLTAPILEVIQATPLEHSALVTIQTNEATTIQLNAPNANVQAVNQTERSATFNLTSLTALTTYEYVVTATDLSGNLAQLNATITTLDLTAPEITVTSNTDGIYSELTVITNENTTVNVILPQALVSLISTNGLTHVFNLTNLSEQTTYNAQVNALDASGNTANTNTEFTTLDKTSPVLTVTQNVLEQSALITINTNEPAQVQITAPGIQVTTLETTSTSSIFNLTGLTALTKYTFNVTATDANENSAQLQQEFTTIDLTPPVIQVTSSPNGAYSVVTVTTNENANVQVTLNGIQVEQTSSDNLTHLFNLTGLSEETTYQIQIAAQDESANQATATHEFTTLDLTAPQITDVQLSVDEHTALITFNTNEYATGVFEYGTTQNYGQQVQTTGLNHALNLNELQSLTTYYYQLTLTDSNGNVAINNGSFNTLDLTAPVITVTNEPSGEYNILTVTTNENSYVSVDFAGPEVTTISTDGFTHVFNITSLTQSTTYSVQISATDDVGNRVNEQSDFTTLDLTSPQINAELTNDHLQYTLTITTNEFANLQIQIPGAQVIQTSSNGLSQVFTITELNDQTTYNYSVIATDESNNSGNLTGEFTTSDYTPPHVVNTSFDVDAQVLQVVLSENATAQLQINTQVLTSENAQTHSFTLTNLPQGTYAYVLNLIDSSGNTLNESGEVTVPDKTAPTISNVNLTVQESTAQVTLETNELSTVVLSYVNSQGAQNITSHNSLTHEFNLVNLIALTEYEITITATDDAQNAITTSEKLTTIDLTAPQFSEVSSESTHENAQITLHTSEYSTVTLNAIVNSIPIQQNSTGLNHVFTLHALQSSTLYDFELTAIDSAGNTQHYAGQFTTQNTPGIDLDADGYYSNQGTLDCNDNNALVNPGKSEVFYNGVDDDCNPLTLDIIDADLDGFNSQLDCNDNNANINPGRTEVIGNGLDDDCNPATLDVIQTVIEGETMPTLNGLVIRRLPDSLAYYANGYSEQRNNYAQGTYQVQLLARADNTPGRIANMRLLVDGVTVKNFAVNTTTFAPFTVNVTLTNASHTIRVQFTNDYYAPLIGEDVNLYLDKITLTKQ